MHVRPGRGLPLPVQTPQSWGHVTGGSSGGGPTSASSLSSSATSPSCVSEAGPETPPNWTRTHLFPLLHYGGHCCRKGPQAPGPGDTCCPEGPPSPGRGPLRCHPPAGQWGVGIDQRQQRTLPAPSCQAWAQCPSPSRWGRMGKNPPVLCLTWVFKALFQKRGWWSGLQDWT